MTLPTVQKIGSLKPKTSAQVTSSRISIGFECLDRKLWSDTDQVYELAGGLGVKWARVQSGWNRTEVEKGNYDFAWFDRIINKLLEQGIQPWVCLCYGNRHYTEVPQDEVKWMAPIYTEEARVGWSQYVAAVVSRYADRVTHYEIWNEPPYFWQNPPALPEDYVKLVKLTAPIIRANNPNSKIVGGSMTGAPHSNEAEYTVQLFQNGLAELIDIYSFHAYSVRPEDAYGPSQMKLLQHLFDTYGGTHLERWQGEGGCPSAPGAPNEALCDIQFNEERQAKHVLRRVICDLALGNDLVSYFQISDYKARGPVKDKTNHYGLLTLDSPPRPKPSYYAFRNLCSLFDSQTVCDPYMQFGVHQASIWSDGMKRIAFNEQIGLRQTTYGFYRKERPLVAYWNASNLISEACGKSGFDPIPIELRIWSLKHRNMDRPVIIDLVNGDVFEASKVHCAPSDSYRHGLLLSGVPLKDYPLIVTDLSAIDDLVQ